VNLFFAISAFFTRFDPRIPLPVDQATIAEVSDRSSRAGKTGLSTSMGYGQDTAKIRTFRNKLGTSVFCEPTDLHPAKHIVATLLERFVDTSGLARACRGQPLLYASILPVSCPYPIIGHLSPLGWEHITLTESYYWRELKRDIHLLRPLRTLPFLSRKGKSE
jgi:hypothetical protein